MGSNETPTRDAAMPADSEIEDGQADPEVQVAKHLVVTSEERKESEILELLRNDQVRTIVLKGEAGVGKTWIAEKISALAVREGLSYHMDWWVYLNQRDESKSLLDKIARQLSVEVTEQEKNAHQLSVEATKGEGNEKEGDIEEKRRKILGTKISAELVKRATELEVKRAAELAKVATKAEAKTPTELEVKKPAGKTKAKKSAQAKRPPAKPETEGSAEPSIEKSEANESAVPEKPPAAQPHKAKFLLLILDGLPDTTTEVDFMAQLKYLEKPNEGQQKLIEGPAYKVLITTRKKDVVKDEGTRAVIEVKELEHESSLSLLRKSVDPNVGRTDHFEKWADKIAKNSDFLPGPIVMIAKALSLMEKEDLEGALRKAAEREKGPDGVNPLLLCVCDMLPSEDEALIHCWWHSYYFFQKQGGLHYDELIACWIVEGCLGDDVGVEKSYKEGYRVLMELKDRGILKVQDDNIVVMGGLAPTRRNYHQDGYEKTTSLGLASAFDAADWQVFGRITLADGIIRAPWNDDKWEEVSTLITSGCPLPGKVHDLLFTEGRTGSPGPPKELQPLKELQVLVLFSPTMDPLPQAFAKMKKLRLLVLRDCDKLGNIDLVGELNSLEILEISGATSLKEMKDDFFNNLKNLRSLNLSDAQIKSVPSSISHLVELRWLILRNLSCLHMVPRLSKLTKLEVLDIRGASQLGRFENKALKPLERLELLNVSKTKLERVPILGSLQNLSRLSLDGCESLPRSSKLGELSKLQVLNVSGNQELEEIPDESRNKKENLRILDLSKTTIRILPFNFKSFIALERLDLSGTKIIKLASLSELKNLEVLDLSDCRDLEEIEADSFGDMPRLRCLNLSETKIERLESLSKLENLRQLLLKNCRSLKEPPTRESLSNLESLSKLEELDLSGVTILKGAKAGYLDRMSDLRRLDLSETGLELAFPHQLTNLTELSLRGCLLPETEPNLGACTELEVLDLSETSIPSLPSSLNGLSRLRELKVRDCFKLAELLHLESLTLLEVLDLFGTRIGQVPPGISNLTSLKHLDLPDLKDSKNFDWESIKPPPEELNWFESGIFKHWENRPCMLLSHDELSKILNDDPELKLPCFQNFHFFVCPSKGQPMAGEIYSHRIYPSPRKLYCSKNDPFLEENGPILEIVGFGEFPARIEVAFRKAKYFSFIDNKFIKSLSEITIGLTEWGEEALTMKGCFLEQCAEMDFIFVKKETEDAEKKTAGGREQKEAAEKKTAGGGEETKVIVVENLETLWASNLLKLKWVFHENAPSQSFDQLTELYLDCCPVLEVVFGSRELPRLKTLQIKFCDNLKRLFSEKIGEPKLPELEKLHLLELPELTSIGVGGSRSVVDIFPSVRSLRLSECRKLILKEIGSLTDITDLYLERCPVLEDVFASSPLPENLEILEIKFCNKLKTLFPPEIEGQLQNLQKLHLVELPELASIGNSQNIGDKFPSVQSIKVSECGKLSLKQIGSSKDLRDLYIERCPVLEEVFASSQLPVDLEILEVRSCNKLKKLFPPAMEGQLEKLRKLHLVQLPELASIGNSRNIGDKFPSVQSIRVTKCGELSLKQIESTLHLRDLYLERCPVLEDVFASSPLLENLEILEIKFCNKLKRLFPSEIEGQWQNLRKLHLVELPELAGIGNSKNIEDKFPSVQSIRVTECQKLSITEIGSPKDLRDLYLERCPELETVFTPSLLPQNLEILEIRFCHELKTLFPQGTTVLPKLEKLHLVELSQLTGIGVQVPEQSDVKDVFPSIQSIKVRKCRKLKGLERFQGLSYASFEDF